MSNEAIRILCELAEALREAEEQGDDKMIGVVPDSLLHQIMDFHRSAYRSIP